MFFPHGRLPARRFVTPDVLSLRTFCPVQGVADPGCYPGSGFFPSQVLDPTKKGEGNNKLLILHFLVEKTIIYFLKGKEKDLSQLTQNFSIFKSKIVTKLAEIWVGSGIWEKPIPDAGVKKAPNPGSGSAILPVR
jgi:hypothetical protein